MLMGDFNEWSLRGGSMREVMDHWNALAPGRSFPSRQPLASLDRIVVLPRLDCALPTASTTARWRPAPRTICRSGRR